MSKEFTLVVHQSGRLGHLMSKIEHYVAASVIPMGVYHDKSFIECVTVQWNSSSVVSPWEPLQFISRCVDLFSDGTTSPFFISIFSMKKKTARWISLWLYSVRCLFVNIVARTRNNKWQQWWSVNHCTDLFSDLLSFWKFIGNDLIQRMNLMRSFDCVPRQ